MLVCRTALRWPMSMSMDTACSSALTAVHIACEQILTGRCKMAMAGGVTVMITPDGQELSAPVGLMRDKNEFIKYLQNGASRFGQGGQRAL